MAKDRHTSEDFVERVTPCASGGSPQNERNPLLLWVPEVPLRGFEPRFPD